MRPANQHIQHQEENSIAVCCKAERIWSSEEHFDIRQEDAGFEVSLAAHSSCVGLAFPHYNPFLPLQDGNAYPVPYYVGGLGSAF